MDKVDLPAVSEDRLQPRRPRPVTRRLRAHLLGGGRGHPQRRGRVSMKTFAAAHKRRGDKASRAPG